MAASRSTARRTPRAPRSPGADGEADAASLGFDVQRHPLAFPVLRPGAFAALQPLHGALEDSALQLAGNYLIYPTFEAAADSGALAAERLRQVL